MITSNWGDSIIETFLKRAVVHPQRLLYDWSWVTLALEGLILWGIHCQGDLRVGVHRPKNEKITDMPRGLWWIVLLTSVATWQPSYIVRWIMIRTCGVHPMPWSPIMQREAWWVRSRIVPIICIYGCCQFVENSSTYGDGSLVHFEPGLFLVLSGMCLHRDPTVFTYFWGHGHAHLRETITGTSMCWPKEY